MLTGLFLAFKGLGLWVRLAIVAAILAVIAGTVWYVYHSIKMTGYREAEAVYKPKVEKLQKDLENANKDLADAVKINGIFKKTIEDLGNQVRAQNLEVDKLKADALVAQAQARDAVARIAANQKRYSAEIARLQAIVNGPPMTEGECEEADSIMRSILRDRLSNDAGATPTTGSRGAQGGDDQGAGAATVREPKRSSAGATTHQDRPQNG